jgi:hypothetical protein
MEMPQTKLDESTTVPLFAVIAGVGVAIPLIIGGILWLSAIDAKASTASEDTKNIRALLTDVRERVIRIEQHQEDSEKR